MHPDFEQALQGGDDFKLWMAVAQAVGVARRKAEQRCASSILRFSFASGGCGRPRVSSETAASWDQDGYLAEWAGAYAEAGIAGCRLQSDPRRTCVDVACSRGRRSGASRTGRRSRKRFLRGRQEHAKRGRRVDTRKVHRKHSRGLKSSCHRVGRDRRRRITRQCSGPSRRVSFVWFESRRGAGSATDRPYVILHSAP